MTTKKKILLWIGIVSSLPAIYYSVMSAIFYAWLNAAEPERWPADKAAVWVYGSIALAVLFISLFVYCVVSLVKDSKRNYDAEQQILERSADK